MKDDDLTEEEIEEREFEQEKKEGFYQTDQNAENETETTRKGLAAYAALTTLIGANLFFMLIGWLIDYKFQTSPWGIVSGIVFGAIIGFYQFVRISSQE